MDKEFIYSSECLPNGITVEEITGGDGLSRRVWELMACQIWAEHAPDGQERYIDHFPSGAPYLCDSSKRISLTHTQGMLAVALIDAPGTDMQSFSSATAIGIDAERSDREKVIALREKFLNPEELTLVAADDVEMNIIAWTAKEALYKAALQSGLDWRNDYVITTLPTPENNGSAEVNIPSLGKQKFTLHTYRRGPFIVTLAWSAC